MKKLLTIIAAVLLIAGCKTPCNDPASPVFQLERGMESSWDCKNHAALERDVSKWFADKGMCEMPKGNTGPIASLVCPIAGMALQHYLGGKVSPEWECDPSKVGSNAVQGLVALCEMIPYEPAPKH